MLSAFLLLCCCCSSSSSCAVAAAADAAGGDTEEGADLDGEQLRGDLAGEREEPPAVSSVPGAVGVEPGDTEGCFPLDEAAAAEDESDERMLW